MLPPRTWEGFSTRMWKLSDPFWEELTKSLEDAIAAPPTLEQLEQEAQEAAAAAAEEAAAKEAQIVRV